LTQIALELLSIKVKTRAVIMQAPMQSMRQQACCFVLRVTLRLGSGRA